MTNTEQTSHLTTLCPCGAKMDVYHAAASVGHERCAHCDAPIRYAEDYGWQDQTDIEGGSGATFCMALPIEQRPMSGHEPARESRAAAKSSGDYDSRRIARLDEAVREAEDALAKAIGTQRAMLTARSSAGPAHDAHLAWGFQRAVNIAEADLVERIAYRRASL